MGSYGRKPLFKEGYGADSSSVFIELHKHSKDRFIGQSAQTQLLWMKAGGNGFSTASNKRASQKA